MMEYFKKWMKGDEMVFSRDKNLLRDGMCGNV